MNDSGTAPLAHEWAATASGRLPKLDACVGALEAVLLFHSGSPWDEAKKLRWMNLTGKGESTTKVLCDTVRAALVPVGFVEGTPLALIEAMSRAGCAEAIAALAVILHAK